MTAARCSPRGRVKCRQAILSHSVVFKNNWTFKRKQMENISKRKLDKYFFEFLLLIAPVVQFSELTYFTPMPLIPYHSWLIGNVTRLSGSFQAVYASTLKQNLRF